MAARAVGAARLATKAFVASLILKIFHFLKIP
jgi:hypothetical protein